MNDTNDINVTNVTNDVNALTYSWSICCRAGYRVGFQWGRGTSFGGQGFAGSLAGETWSGIFETWGGIFETWGGIFETWGGKFFFFIQILSAI